MINRVFGRCAAVIVAVAAMLALGAPGAVAADYKNNDESALFDSEIENNITQVIEQVSGRAAEEFFPASLEMAESLEISTSSLESAYIGAPFYIYEIEDPDKVDIYYYPVLEADTNNVLYVLSVWKTTDGWSFDVSDDYVEKLQQVGYPENQYVFYGDNSGVVAAENGEGVQVFQGNQVDALLTSCQGFSANKLDVISNAAAHVDEFDAGDALAGDHEDILAGYSPLLYEATSQTYCELFRKKGQGNTYTMLCWAATVATIVNYRKGENVTATDVASAMGIRYNSGAYMTDSKQALQKYGCTAYDYIDYSRLSWKLVKKNINNKKPVYLKSDNGSVGHAIVLYGYGVYDDDTKYLITWNPGLKDGNGAVQNINYGSSSTTFRYGNYTMSWTGSLYAVSN